MIRRTAGITKGGVGVAVGAGLIVSCCGGGGGTARPREVNGRHSEVLAWTIENHSLSAPGTTTCSSEKPSLIAAGSPVNWPPSDVQVPPKYSHSALSAPRANTCTLPRLSGAADGLPTIGRF